MMDGKPDLRPCPFCGSRELRYMMLNVSKIKVMVGLKCQKCLTCGPGECGKDREEAETKAAEAWNRRAEPENRVLTLEELEAHCKGGADAAPVWIEFYFNPGLGRWVLVCAPDMTCVTPEACSTMTIKPYTEGKHWQWHYGKLWRCWLRKPTAEEMANTIWEE